MQQTGGMTVALPSIASTLDPKYMAHQQTRCQNLIPMNGCVAGRYIKECIYYHRNSNNIQRLSVGMQMKYHCQHHAYHAAARHNRHEMKIVIHFCLDKFMKLHSISIKEYNLRKQQHPAVVYR